MHNYTSPQASTPPPPFEVEVTQILEGNDRVNNVAFRGQHTWTLDLRCVDCDEAETARLEIVDDLMETLGEEACEGLAFRSHVDVLNELQGRFRVEIEILDEDDLDADDDESDNDEAEIEPSKDDYLDRFVTLTAQYHYGVSVLLGNIIAAATERLRETGQESPNRHEIDKSLSHLGTSQAIWKTLIDEPTNTVRIQALEAEIACIVAVANALEIDVATAVRALDAYGADVEEGEFPTGSFTRWYHDWLAAMEEAAAE